MRLTKHISLAGGGRFGLSNPYDCSIYAIDFADGVILVDSGCGLEPELVEANLQMDGIDIKRVTAIVLTHAHADHAGGCRWWKDRTGCQIYAPEGERGAIEGTDAVSAQVLETAKQAKIYPPDYVLSSIKVDVGVHDGDDLRFGALHLRAIEIAGHSPHHTCYRTDMDGRRIFFSGDAVLYGGSLLLQNIPGCSLDEYRRDIDKLTGLDADILLPGHGIFVMRHAQAHLNRALEALHSLAIPPNFAVLCPKVIP
jgi:glyoxylase-like metal-dependent hydrolase (beta-lactamase superfamily II)